MFPACVLVWLAGLDIIFEKRSTTSVGYKVHALVTVYCCL